MMLRCFSRSRNPHLSSIPSPEPSSLRVERKLRPDPDPERISALSRLARHTPSSFSLPSHTPRQDYIRSANKIILPCRQLRSLLRKNWQTSKRTRTSFEVGSNRAGSSGCNERKAHSASQGRGCYVSVPVSLVCSIQNPISVNCKFRR